MEKYKVLNATQIVDKGAVKVSLTLPEIGIKEVNPNGSWLQQKQIQTALEARKHLIEVERIEKSGSLSHAEWRHELMLAEVTQQTGGYWQYVGHSVDGLLFLYPEEALFLLESNCLLLRYNNVPVSLEQAYPLLLCGKLSTIHYRVYAYFSRLGYKVFRHKKTIKDIISKQASTCDTNSKQALTCDTDVSKQAPTCNTDPSKQTSTCDTIISKQASTSDTVAKETKTIDVHISNNSPKNNIIEINANGIETAKSSDILRGPQETADEILCMNDTVEGIPITSSESCLEKVPDTPENNRQCLTEKTKPKYSRIFKVCQVKDKIKYFNDIPDLIQNKTATVTTPAQQFLPQNLNVKDTYVLNMENVRNKPVNNIFPTSHNDSRAYSVTDEVNGSHVRRIRGHSPDNQNFNNFDVRNSNNGRFSHPNFHNRQFNYWRGVLPNMNYLQFRMFCQRPFFPHIHMFLPRFQTYHRAPQFPINFSYLNCDRKNSRKRTRDLAKGSHLEAIRHLARRSKMLILIGTSQPNIIEPLQRLISTFNIRYKTNIRLSPELDVIEETIAETIELDDDESSKSKKPRLKENNDCYHENFSKLKQLSDKLKYLESKGTASAIHRRAFSNAVKTFNNSYKADVYVDHNYEIVDRKFITLDSSDSDCVVEEKVPQKSKKLWNPFSGLNKDLITPHGTAEPSTSQSHDANKDNNRNDDMGSQYNDLILQTFDKRWLPEKSDFGRAEVTSKDLTNIRLLDTVKESLLYDFLKGQHCKFSSWIDLKSVFFQNFERTPVFENEAREHILLDSLVKPEDCTNMHSVLKKLNIIKTETGIKSETSLRIDFDVYNKDVKTFKKSNPPKPHFRLVCLCESSEFPSGSDIATLHSEYKDDVPVIFAIVGTSSVSYLQINPSELPLYIPQNIS